jgi:Ca2+-binding RTX toxin-like protein
VLGAEAGNDWLIGEQGNDLLFGQAGNDRFVFNLGDGNDTVGDLAVANGAGDLMDLRGYASVGVTNFTTLQSRMSQSGADVLITFDASNHILLQNTLLNQLHQADFLFT